MRTGTTMPSRLARGPLWTGILLLLLAAGGVFAAPSQSSAPAGAADPGVLSLEEYIAALDQLAPRMESAGPNELAAIRKSLPDSWRVRHRGQTVEVSLVWLGDLANTALARPKESEVLMGRARRRVQHLRDEAQAWLESEPVESGAAREQLEAILERPEFGKVRGPNWLDRLRARISEWLMETIFGALERVGGFSVVGGVILWSLIAFSLCVVVIWGLRLFQGRARDLGEELKGTKVEKYTWRRWAQQALASAAGGDYRAAVHHAYWASIYRMEELGAWEIDRARTHREYLRLLPPQHDQRANLTGLTRRFEAVWYGRQTATADDFREASASLEKLGCLLASMPATANS